MKNQNCPCKNTARARHGDCAACKSYHAKAGGKTTCQRTQGK